MIPAIPFVPLVSVTFAAATPAPLIAIPPTPARTVPVYGQGAIFRDVYATPAGNDIDLSFPAGAALVADVDAIAQQTNIRLSIQTGTVPYDLDIGVDYASQIFGVGNPQARWQVAIRRAILSVPGIRAVTSLTSERVGDTAVINWTATTIQAGIASGQIVVNGGA